MLGAQDFDGVALAFNETLAQFLETPAVFFGQFAASCLGVQNENSCADKLPCASNNDNDIDASEIVQTIAQVVMAVCFLYVAYYLGSRIDNGPTNHRPKRMSIDTFDDVEAIRGPAVGEACLPWF
jgi:hypothetical protein